MKVRLIPARKSTSSIVWARIKMAMANAFVAMLLRSYVRIFFHNIAKFTCNWQTSEFCLQLFQRLAILRSEFLVSGIDHGSSGCQFASCCEITQRQITFGEGDLRLGNLRTRCAQVLLPFR